MSEKMKTKPENSSDSGLESIGSSISASKDMAKDEIIHQKKEPIIVNEESLREKKSHSISEGCNFFPNHTWLFILYVFLMVILGVFGTILIISGNWANSGYLILTTILNRPFPNIEVEDEEETVFALEFLQLSSWICGFFLWLFAIYLLYVVHVYYQLIFPNYPWNANNWNSVRLSANKVLVESKVRDETVGEQFERLNKRQRSEMEKFKRGFIDPEMFNA